MDINVRAPFHLTQMLLPFLQKAKGCIINIGSIFGHKPCAGSIGYCMSKAGL